MKREYIAKRDREIVKQVVTGKPRQDIAEQFHISVSRINQIYTQARYCGGLLDNHQR
jgi:DNA-binding CsgD family transcriptional regulator